MKKLRNSIAFKSIAGIVASLIVFSVIVSIIGYMEFKDAMMQQYARGAFYTADAAAFMVKADHLQMYLDSGGAGEDPDGTVACLADPGSHAAQCLSSVPGTPGV